MTESARKAHCKRRHRLVILAVAVMVTGAQAELVDIAWDSAGRFETSMSVAPGKFAEVCGQLAKGQSVAWSFKVGQPMNFNIHYHEDKQVVFPVKQDLAVAAQGKLDVVLSQDYCWMWTNKGTSPSKLTLNLAR